MEISPFGQIPPVFYRTSFLSGPLPINKKRERKEKYMGQGRPLDLKKPTEEEETTL